MVVSANGSKDFTVRNAIEIGEAVRILVTFAAGKTLLARLGGGYTHSDVTGENKSTD